MKRMSIPAAVGNGKGLSVRADGTPQEHIARLYGAARRADLPTVEEEGGFAILPRNQNGLAGARMEGACIPHQRRKGRRTQGQKQRTSNDQSKNAHPCLHKRTP